MRHFTQNKALGLKQEPSVDVRISVAFRKIVRAEAEKAQTVTLVRTVLFRSVKASVASV